MPRDPHESPVLDARGLSKTFAGQKALDDVDLRLEVGEIRALVGENGSGKSTLVKILAGYHTPDAGGAVTVAGTHLTLGDGVASTELGLCFVHQDLGLVPTLDAVDNLGLGIGYGTRRGRPISWSARRREARTLLDDLGYDIDVTAPVGSLQASERTALAVARAIFNRGDQLRVLVLDEPTANLPGPEVERLFALMRRVRDRGAAVLFLSHHLTEVFEIADSVTVLRDGKHVGTRPVAGLEEDGLVEMMVGQRIDRMRTDVPAPGGEPIVVVEGLSGSTVANVSFEVRPGEILGIAGITGSGREVIAPMLFGGLPRSGSVSVRNKDLPPRRADLAIRAGVALIPADRVANGLLTGHTVRENLVMARRGDFMRRGFLRKRLETMQTRTWIDRVDVRPPQTEALIGQLSGGNAQKVVVARWLRLAPDVLIVDEPTQGVDIAAAMRIRALLMEVAQNGAAVIVCSTDSEELAQMSTRVLVLDRGRIAHRLNAPVDGDTITAACLTSTTKASAS